MLYYIANSWSAAFCVYPINPEARHWVNVNLHQFQSRRVPHARAICIYLLRAVVSPFRLLLAQSCKIPRAPVPNYPHFFLPPPPPSIPVRTKILEFARILFFHSNFFIVVDFLFFFAFLIFRAPEPEVLLCVCFHVHCSLCI